MNTTEGPQTQETLVSIEHQAMRLLDDSTTSTFGNSIPIVVGCIAGLLVLIAVVACCLNQSFPRQTDARGLPVATEVTGATSTVAITGNGSIIQPRSNAAMRMINAERYGDNHMQQLAIASAASAATGVLFGVGNTLLTPAGLNPLSIGLTDSVITPASDPSVFGCDNDPSAAASFCSDVFGSNNPNFS